ncbi:MAG: single-stranded-DNA-specific exonuclease RecJ [Thermoflexales bacterium]|nr:single-stranded-DNA-specific exonuclease RecJ [Thermoflexales bacterium]MDW8351618.1 single-stranded-DNA-specific exonuclease RecJ [Anaerolineae bacterium]
MAEWKIAPRAPADYFAALSDLHPLTAQVLHARGLTDPAAARAFVRGAYAPADPFALQDMSRAVARVLSAIANGESIAVYADYDCDGVTAGALLIRTLNALGGRTQIYIPDRFEEGYGLNAQALEYLRGQGVSLVVTVDCGARAHLEARRAREIGLDLIVTDHHELEDEAIPDAYAVVDPKRPDCPYGFKHLAGVGVAFRMAQCLLRRARDAGLPRSELTEASLLDLVALGTVADVVPIIGENRALVRAGLERINRQPQIGVRALIQAAGLRPGAVNAERIGFALGPRLNAAGRLEHARAAYDLLTCDDPERATALAEALNRQNSERQDVTAVVAESAERQALETHARSRDDAPLPPLLFAAAPEYHLGVIGLAASRLVEKYQRPAVVVSIHGQEARGSCRSVGEFDIIAALDTCADLLLKHGGHEAAAGFTTRTDALDALRERLSEIARRSQPEGGWARVIHADAEITLAEVNHRSVVELQQLEPHGPGNPKPTFVVRGARVSDLRRIGRAENGAAPPHLQLRVTDARRVIWDAIAWRMGDRIQELDVGASVDLVCQLDVNEWNGESRLRLEVLDFRAARAA